MSRILSSRPVVDEDAKRLTNILGMALEMGADALQTTVTTPQDPILLAMRVEQTVMAMSALIEKQQFAIQQLNLDYVNSQLSLMAIHARMDGMERVLSEMRSPIDGDTFERAFETLRSIGTNNLIHHHGGDGEEIQVDLEFTFSDEDLREGFKMAMAEYTENLELKHR